MYYFLKIIITIRVIVVRLFLLNRYINVYTAVIEKNKGTNK